MKLKSKWKRVLMDIEYNLYSLFLLLGPVGIFVLYIRYGESLSPRKCDYYETE